MSREVMEGLQSQGPNEEIIYTIEVTPAADSVTSIAVTDLTTGETVTGTVMPGSASASEGAIVLPALKALVKGHLYQVAALYSNGDGSKLEPLIQVLCQ